MSKEILRHSNEILHNRTGMPDKEERTMEER